MFWSCSCQYQCLTLSCIFFNYSSTNRGSRCQRLSDGVVLTAPMIVCVARLRATSYVIVKHLLHYSAVPTTSTTSEEGRSSDRNLVYGHSCSNRLAITYCRLAYVGFYTVCLVLPILVVCCRRLSLSADVCFGFLSDAFYQSQDN